MAAPRVVRHRVEYGLTVAAESILGRLDAGAAERVGEVLGDWARRPLRIRREVVEANLRRAFPDADADWIATTVHRTYRHLGREAAAMLRLSTLDPDSLREIVYMPDETWTKLQTGLAEGRGAILATGHYGNWEMAAAGVAARGVPIEAIVKRQRNRLVDTRIEAARRALGVETVDMGEAPRRVPRALLAGRTVGIVADQDAGPAGLFVPFFGHLASSHRGPALFALRLGAPLFAAVARRMPDGRYLLQGDRIDTTRTDSLQDDVERITAALAAHLEREIRVDPAQYFWFHKRWKSAAREEHLSSVPGTNTRSGRGASAP